MRLLAFVLSSCLLAPAALAQGGEGEEPIHAKPNPAAKAVKPAPEKAKAKRKGAPKGAEVLPGRTATNPKGLNPSRTYKPKPGVKEEEEEAAQPVKGPEKPKDRGAPNVPAAKGAAPR
ncbi:MAG: hypothetical protein H6704_12680 [Myxococcales bacterium]|nr:hypothetical protein [Myxococcales bacterium]